MGVERLSVIILALMFVTATWRDLNMGVLGFVAAFVLGTFFLGLGINDVWKRFLWTSSWRSWVCHTSSVSPRATAR